MVLILMVLMKVVICFHFSNFEPLETAALDIMSL